MHSPDSCPRRAALAIAGALFAPTALAGGFYVSELGTPGSLGTGGVLNSVNDSGADSAWTNPAGMTGLDQDTVVGGMQLIFPNVEFDVDVATGGGSDGGNAGVLTGAPSMFGVKVLSDRARVGIGVSALLGGGVDYGNAFVGRYSANKAVLAGVGISPSFGYKVNDRLSLGAGVSLVYTMLDEEISIRQPGFADAEMSFDKIDDVGWQGFAGLQYQASERLLLGLVYRTKSDVDLSGDVKFNGLAIPVTPRPKITVSWENPQLLEVGLRYQVSDELFLIANFDWEDWSEFSDNRLAFSGGPFGVATTLRRNFEDTYHVGGGVIFRRGREQWAMAVGYDTSPVDDADRTFDLPLDEQIKLSVGYFRERRNGFDFGLGASLLYAGEAAVDQTSQGVRAKGKFDENWLLFVGATLRHRF